MPNSESEKHEDRIFFLLTERDTPMTAREISIVLGIPLQSVSSTCSRLVKKGTLFAIKGIGAGKNGNSRMLTKYTSSCPSEDDLAASTALVSRRRAHTQKNPAPTLQGRIERLMSDGAVRTSQEIIDALDEKRGSVTARISDMVRDGYLNAVDDLIRARLGAPGYVRPLSVSDWEKQRICSRVMAVMSDRAPRTAKEIYLAVNRAALHRLTKLNSITPRISELVTAGNLKRVDNGETGRGHMYLYARQYLGESIGPTSISRATATQAPRRKSVLGWMGPFFSFFRRSR